MILNDEQLSELRRYFLGGNTIGIEWCFATATNLLDTIAHLQRQLAERDALIEKRVAEARAEIAAQLYRMCVARGDAGNGSLVWVEIRTATGTIFERAIPKPQLEKPAKAGE